MKLTFQIACAMLFSLCSWKVAHATGGFPEEMQEILLLDYRPECALCHAGGVAKSSSVTTPFGVKMKQLGLIKRDYESLHRALSELEIEKSDVDGDGVPDIDELLTGSNPNYVPGDGAPPPVHYGCGIRSTPRLSESSPQTALVGAAIFFLLTARWSSKR